MEDRDRRSHRRLMRDAQVSCQEVTYPLGLAPEIAVRMVDLSEGGVRLLCGTPFAVEVLLQMAVKIEGWQRHTASFSRYDDEGGSRPLTALGKVVRSAPADGGEFEIGVQFVDIWDDHWRAVRLFLEKELARESASGGTERSRA